MKLAYANYTDISGGVTESADFKMEFNAIAAYQLMSGIAKNKIAYPIRELCTNAWDASRGDFYVSLPTRWNETFTVRDYGPGLTHAEIINNYTCFFGSTKRDTNDAVGALGLGSKSPFAYLLSTGDGAGAFTVKSYNAGVVRTYVMALSSGGMPQVRLLGEEPSDERSGLEVSFPVRYSDIYDFSSEARKILWFFQPRPTVSPELFGSDPDEVVASGTNWAVYDKDKVPFQTPYVRMGCVAYPIDFAQLDRSDWPWQRSALVFEAPIGSLTITTSREALGYDNNTKATLQSLIETYERELSEQLQTQIDAQPSYLAACAHLISRSYTLGNKQVQALLPYLLYEGRQLRLSFKIRLKHMFLVIDKDNPQIFEASKREIFGSSDVTSWLPKVKFLVEKKPRYSSLKLQKLIADGQLAHDDHVIWIRLRDDEPLHLEQFGDPPYINLDTVKIATSPGPRVKRPKNLQRLWFLNPGSDTVVPDWVDASEDLVYVRKGKQRYHRRYYDVGFPRSQSSPEIKNQINILAKYGIATPRIVVIKDSVPQPHWKKFHDFVVSEVEAALDQNEVAIARGMNDALAWQLKILVEECANVTSMPADIKALIDRAEQYETLRKTTTVSEKTKELLTLLPDPTTTKVGEAAEIDRAWESLCAKYRLLDCTVSRVGHYYHDKDHLSELAYYLNLEAQVNP